MEQVLNNVNVISMIIPKLDFSKSTCQLISNKVLAVSGKGFIFKGIKV
jgi:hypothetical protein